LWWAREEVLRLRLVLLPVVPLLPPPLLPVVGDDGEEVWPGVVAVCPVGGFEPVMGVIVGGVTGGVDGGAGVEPSGSETGGVLTVTDGTLGVETLTGVFGTVTVIGETDGVVTVTPGSN
jgi:hypothetical protein